ncbi:MAG TPA: DUF3631 domain-containing protein [Candidatus Angelobacter sp.]
MNWGKQRLSKMLAGLEGKPATDAAPAQPKEVKQTSPAASPASPSPQVHKPVDAPELLNQIIAFFRHYLVCNDHQLTMLALWTLHTWCYKSFPSTPYLDVRSPAPQSGKSLCLKLLEALSPSPVFASGANADTVMKRLLTAERILDNDDDSDNHHHDKEGLPESPTLFLDDCQYTFSTAERQALLALFNAGAERTSSYPSGYFDYYVFGPRAFAGNSLLPRSLADRCVPIVLQRKKPSDVVRRFNSTTVRDAGAKLAKWMKSWALDNSDALARMAPDEPPRLPLNLTPREQQCAEPLVHIADRIGGPWPERARAAVAAVFNLPQSALGLQLLSDVHSVFHVKNHPDHLATRDILQVLTSLEFRPWSAWTGKSGRQLGALLHPFGIHSSSLHYGDKPAFRGFFRKSFLEAWERYLPPLTVCPATDTAEKTPSEATKS